MFSKMIEFKNLDKNVQKDAIELIEYFNCCLRNNGQILPQYLFVQNSDDYILYVTTPHDDSLDKRFDSIYVKRAREKISEFFTVSVVRIGINANSREYCSCKTRTAIEMQTFANDIDSVFTCCTCGKPIALYELPYLDNQDEHWRIVNWQKTYGATDILWLDSLSDRFTGNQLVNVNSVLNKQGREIADEISKKTSLKVYYNIFGDLKKVKYIKLNGKIVRICPCCEKPMTYVKFCDDYEVYICEDCSLSSDIPKHID